MSAPPLKTGPPARAAAAHTVHAEYLWPRRPRAVIPEGPHRRDVPLRDIIDILLTARPAGLSVEGDNPQHAHEWNVFQTVRLPPGKVLIPGVLDTTTNFIEHPELVAQRMRIVNTNALRRRPPRPWAPSSCAICIAAAFAAT